MGIEAGQAKELSRQLVDMGRKSSASFSSSVTMEQELITRGISKQVAGMAASPVGLRTITLAAGDALRARETKADALGGIDINPAFLKLLVKRDGNGVAVPVGNVNLKDTDIYGFEPVISKVEPVEDLPAFIGIK